MPLLDATCYTILLSNCWLKNSLENKVSNKVDFNKAMLNLVSMAKNKLYFLPSIPQLSSITCERCTILKPFQPKIYLFGIRNMSYPDLS